MPQVDLRLLTRALIRVMARCASRVHPFRVERPVTSKEARDAKAVPRYPKVRNPDHPRPQGWRNAQPLRSASAVWLRPTTPPSPGFWSRPGSIPSRSRWTACRRQKQHGCCRTARRPETGPQAVGTAPDLLFANIPRAGGRFRHRFKKPANCKGRETLYGLPLARPSAHTDRGRRVGNLPTAPISSGSAFPLG
jgi:hypothetical protein